MINRTPMSNVRTNHLGAARSMLLIVGVLLGVCSNTLHGADFDVVFRGNDTLTDSYLRNELDPWILELEKSPEDPVLQEDLAFEMSAVYRARGFPDATTACTYQIRHGGPEVVLSVVEGARRLVGKTVINGAAVPEATPKVFGWLSEGVLDTGKKVFTESELAGGVSELVLIHRLSGFLDCRATVETADKPIRSGRVIEVHVVVTIAPGERYRVGEIEITGELPLTRSEALSIAKLETGAVYTPRLPAEVRGRLRAGLGARGFYDPTVSVRSRDEGPAVRAMEIVVDAGSTAIIDEIVFKGNEHTRDSWIRDRLRFQRGHAYVSDALRASQRDLLASGLFKSVDIDVSPLESDPTRLSVLVRVLEKDRIRVSGRVGAGSYEIVRVGAGILHRNLWGRGVRGSFDARASFRGEQVNLSLRYPDLFGRSFALQVKTGYERYEHPSFTEQGIFGEIGVDHRVNREWRLATGYRFEVEEILDVDDLVVDPDLVEDVQTGLLFFAVRNDTRDQILDPREGWFARARIEFANEALGSEIAFLRPSLEATHYWSWGEDEWTLVTSAMVGVVEPLQSDEIPLTERYFLGGARSVRSYKRDELGPKDAGGEPIGGEAVIHGSIELRRRVGSWGLALFFDTGSLTDRSSEFGEGRFHHGVGGGVFWNSLIGPIRADAAYNPARESGEDHWAFHFLLGHPF